MQFQADVLNTKVVKPAQHETTAIGVARLAGLTVGLWSSQEELAKAQEIECCYLPQMENEERENKMKKWHRAVERSLGWELS